LLLSEESRSDENVIVVVVVRYLGGLPHRTLPELLKLVVSDFFEVIHVLEAHAFPVILLVRV
jgi:hypothetical protein